MEAFGGRKDTQYPEWPVELTPEESLRQLNFWLLYFIFGIGSACGLLFLNNAGTPSPAHYTSSHMYGTTAWSPLHAFSAESLKIISFDQI